MVPLAGGISMQLLNRLITAAMELACDDGRVSHGSRLWESIGGRQCPLGWPHCSQPVYMDIKTGEYDYGEPGGPGHAVCTDTCSHGMQVALELDEDWIEP